MKIIGRINVKLIEKFPQECLATAPRSCVHNTLNENESLLKFLLCLVAVWESPWCLHLLRTPLNQLDGGALFFRMNYCNNIQLNCIWNKFADWVCKRWQFVYSAHSYSARAIDQRHSITPKDAQFFISRIKSERSKIRISSLIVHRSSISRHWKAKQFAFYCFHRQLRKMNFIDRVKEWTIRI